MSTLQATFLPLPREDAQPALAAVLERAMRRILLLLRDDVAPIIHLAGGIDQA